MGALSHRRYRQKAAAVLAASRICWLCGKDGADTVDHVQERSRGGAVLDMANLRPAHGRKQHDEQGNETCPGNFGRSNRKYPVRLAW